MKKERTYNLNLFFLIFPLMIIIGKVIRWTVLKSVLVDMSIGNGMIGSIISHQTVFASFVQEEISEGAKGNAAAIFDFINIFNLQTTTGFEVYISILWNLILIGFLLKSIKSLNTMQFTFLSLSIAVLNIWDFCLAKEPVQMLFFVLIAIVLISKKLNIKLKYFLVTIILFLSILYFRTYYVLVLAFLYIVAIICSLFLLKRDKIKLKHVTSILILLAFIYFIMLNGIKFISPDSYAELIRVRTRGGVAHTQMVNIFKSQNLVIFSIDYFLMIIRMLFPVELLPMGPKYWPYVLYQLVISYFAIKGLKNLKNKNNTEKIAIYLYVAFLLSSATFEPDFGSWVRHEAAIFPVLMIVTDIIPVIDLKKENNNEKEINKIN